ncbi:MAG: SEC-C domain-containing protein [Gammaproteobacteria bacterium]|nr:SEC-C domain-containing protein [Gammaproteobacteria bacterium]
MVNIPAFCDTCGASFPSGFAFENCSNVHLSGNKSGPCPRCGGMGSVPDGVFNITGNVIEILSAPTRTIEQLTVLSKILKIAASSKKSPEEIAKEIEDKVPDLSLIAKYIPKNASELVAWLTFILLAIQTINQLGKDDVPDVNVILNQSVEQSMRPENYYPFVIPQAPISRNAPCPCGSGQRYKHCCGKAI